MSIVLNASVGDHLKATVHDRPAEQVITHKMHVMRFWQLLACCARHQLWVHLRPPF